MKVPEGAHRADLLLLWPVVLCDVLSVVNIGIYWNNHPHMFHSVRHLGGAGCCGRTCVCCSGCPIAC